MVAVVVPGPESGVVYFDFDSAELTPEAMATIDQLVADGAIGQVGEKDLGAVA